MISRKASLLMLWAISFFLTACSGDAPPEKPVKKPITAPATGGVYRRAFADSYIILDPALIKDSNSHEVARQIFDGLIEFNDDAQPVPSLAENWQISTDKLLYTFKLREDVKFHRRSSGKPTRNGGRLMTAEDVVYSFKRLLKPGKDSQGAFFHVIKGAADYSSGKTTELVGVKAVATFTVSFELEKPFAPFVSLLGMCNAFIVPQEDCEAVDLKDMPVGCGPFEWGGREGETLVLLANEEYFRGRPRLDKIEFVVVADEAERYRLFREGHLMHVDVPDSEYKNVKQDPRLSKYLLETSRWGTNYLGMNLKMPPFNDVLVRQAINYAIDRDPIVELVLNNRAKTAYGVLPPGITGYDPNLRGYSFDPEKARALLAKAGYPDGKGFPEIELQYNKDIIHTRIGDFILANLSDIGIKCRVKELGFGEHLNSIEAGQAGFFRMGWTVDYPDPDSFLYTLFHSSNIGSGYNFTGLSSPELDKLLDQARFETETSRRVSLYRQAEKLIIEQAPWVFLYFYTTHLLYQPQVREINLGPMGQPFIRYRQIWLQPR